MIREEQESWLRERFRHFNAERCAEMFHEEQPQRGMHLRQRSGQEFPAVVFKNNVIWYPRREQRPVHRDGVNPVKADSPANVRPLLYDTLDPDELVIVEGEGQLLACLSVGLRGVVAAGGVNALHGRSTGAYANRAMLRGKAIRILFDPDEHGIAAGPRVERALREGGAGRVAIVDLRQAGVRADMDVEDWLGTFDTPADAHRALRELLLAAEWDPEAGGADEDVPIQEIRILREGDPIPTLAVMVWDAVSGAQLAAYGPSQDEESPSPGRSVRHDEPSADSPRGWMVAPTLRFSGTSYVPDLRGDVIDWIQSDSLILPPPPFIGSDPSEQLWTDLRNYYQRWFAVRDIYYDVMVAYCLLTYRLLDAGFDHIGFLRFVGPPSSGKNRALDVMRYTCWKAYTTQPTSANLHRITHYFGNFTLLIDEFHPSRGRNDTQVKELVDIFNLSFQRSASMARMDRAPDGSLFPRLFRVFGPKIFTSYESDEDEAFARRTILIPTGEVEVPLEMMKPQLPPEAKDEARVLRARLLAWRGRKLASGLPELGGASWQRLLEASGAETGQVFWPLIEMVPAAHEDARNNLIELARGRREATQATRYATEEAYLLDVLAGLWEAGCFHRVTDGWFISTREVTEEIPSGKYFDASRVGRMLKSLGLRHCTRRYVLGAEAYQRKGFLIDDSVEAIMRRHGVTWPRPNGAESEFEEVVAL